MNYWPQIKKQTKYDINYVLKFLFLKSKLAVSQKIIFNQHLH